jgi:hypothetical protein
MKINGYGYFVRDNGKETPPTHFIPVFSKEMAMAAFSDTNNIVSLILCIDIDNQTMKWCTNVYSSNDFYDGKE